MARINGDHGHACKRRFVMQERPELTERPIVVLGALLLAANPCPRTNPRQIFDGNAALCVFSLRNKLLGNAVVGGLLKAALFAADLFQAPFGAFGPNGLQPIPPALVALAHLFNLRPAVRFAVAIRRKVYDAQINADHAHTIRRSRLGHMTDGKEVERALDVGKICFTFTSVQKFPLPASRNKRNGLSAVHRPDRYARFVRVPAQNAIIVGNAAMRPEGPLDLAIQLVRIGHFPETAHHKLGRQAKQLAGRRVAAFMQIELPERLRVPRRFAHGVARGVRHFQRLQQHCRLFRRWLQFELGDQFHGCIVLNPCGTYSHTSEERFLRPGTL